jgi:Protein of unknown function (DUF805)
MFLAKLDSIGYPFLFFSFAKNTHLKDIVSDIFSNNFFMSHSPSVDKGIDARYYLSSQGRMSRKHYLITISFILIIGIGLLAFISTLNSPALVIPVFLVTGYLTIVSGVKRLHDIGMSGLHMLWIIFFSIL